MSDTGIELNKGRTIEEGKELVSKRIRRSSEAYEQLIKKARVQTILGTVFRIVTIVLGAMVAIQGAIEQLMTGQSEEDLRMIVGIFALIGLAIAIIAGLQQAFKFEQKGSGLSELAQKAQSEISTYMLSAKRSHE